MRFSIISLVSLPLFLGLTYAGGVEKDERNNVCTVKANGKQKDDMPNLFKAFKECGNGGTIIFPEDQSYWIGTRLNPLLNDVTVQWRGKWTFSDNLDYRRNNSFPVAFQNHRVGFIISGHNVTIDGNGNTWYTAEKGVTQSGRPMPFVFWNVSEVNVENFYVKDPPLWSLNIMNGTNMRFNNIYCNATSVDAPYGYNWVQNTDGFGSFSAVNTMDAVNIQLTNFVYQGGDDCITIKPRSYNIDIQNVTCVGGNGIAVGSLGQYLEDSSVENVRVDKVKIIRYNEDMHNSAYIKTWVGALVPQSSYESAGLPCGGGWGNVRNILFSNFEVQGANAGPSVNQDSGNNGSYSGSSLMTVSNIVFANFTGYTSGGTSVTSKVSCSEVHPCYNIEFDDVLLYPGKNASNLGTGSCKYTANGGVHGLEGC
ncbi:putative extracellular exo-polygalacturonase [Aspergillus fischeri NRRL 181]|uniref:Putative galacturan 1,4-alpha-galacturonidase C n=1 Tax=Neosartorya fischeri (strain ATCC 1020 / DSM 3700 / CBS 544.65 / FGSC A1164 / JCM 1740 / NRRL 181 / WB 181) TaxID=331117 RepID=RGXC_NEOFI|nr:polygalacturonase, putative [Aspergillus fischeri NRRL 181]A1D415.1 RecName: Full=Putative galacturan 1,4-alpha-galacturonidase C; AltName: Full=Exopolygalacturonase C; AltName: Full=Exorhamnogalacturonase C; AltName: Full=Poly(1,4-alpha-D-galacturonide)galacturonohydrolase C; Flags: Precursor [Aspergillus fischeri NRRL 181]EAW23158.1 polygalacturonase, putative [Aspergillus fischeri NRRL 181]